jgi:hypothetical protein
MGQIRRLGNAEGNCIFLTAIPPERESKVFVSARVFRPVDHHRFGFVVLPPHAASVQAMCDVASRWNKICAALAENFLIA